jgi:peptidoglycan hydrolase-like protein with peptidoglycan-binding domain
MAPRRAKSTAMLLEQVNQASPDRSKKDDGWIGDAAHASRASDHNPNKAGVVQAQDITHDPPGFDSYAFAEVLRTNKDKRLKYVISNKKIFAGNAGPQPWTWRNYSGSNPHDKHVHISVANDVALYDDPSAWNIGGGDTPTPPPPNAMPTLRKGDTGVAVVHMQTLIPKWIDGIFGDTSEALLKEFQRAKGLTVDAVCGDETWNALLGGETDTTWESGKGSWYSWYTGEYTWEDHGDKPNSNALGVPDDQQGYALYNKATLGGWADVKAPNGKILRLQQTDIGPHPDTGRKIDIAAVAAERFGYTPTDFPTDQIFYWRHV